MCLFTNRSNYSTCITVLPLDPFVPPILSSQPRIGDNLRLAHNGFNARHKYHRDTSHSYNVINEFDIAALYGFLASRYGVRASRVNLLSVFSLKAGWIACCSWLILLCDGQKIATYEAYWFMNFPIINYWGTRSLLFVLKCHEW